MGAARCAGCQVKQVERREGLASGHSRLTPSDSSVVPHPSLVLRYSRSPRHCFGDGMWRRRKAAEGEEERSEEEKDEEEEEQF